MIAAQLLAYYFTELKDDQVKKVSGLCLLIAVRSKLENDQGQRGLFHTCCES